MESGEGLEKPGRREFLKAIAAGTVGGLVALNLKKTNTEDVPEREGEKPADKLPSVEKSINPKWVILDAQKRFLESLNGGDFENIYKGGAKKLAEILDEKLSHSVESEMTPEVKEKVKTGINLWFQKFKGAHPDDWTAMQLINARDAWVVFLEKQLDQFGSNSPDIQQPKL